MKEVTPEQLAIDFISVIQDWLSDEELANLRKKNQKRIGTFVCASHDFCDANQAMIEAIEKNGIELNIQSENQLNLINSAWDIAKRNEFRT